MGRAAAIRRITAGDLKQFYRRHYTQANLTIAVAGGYPADFPARVEKDFAALEKGAAARLKLPPVKTAPGRRLTLVEKDTRSVAMSIGFPIHVRRGHAEYVALLVAASWLGQHRNSGVRLYDRIREVRGLNYGDYAYIEYFPRGMFLMEPDPNLARRQQIFQVWIRPVAPETAHFTLRLAFFELERLYRDGMSAEDFTRTRNFLSKYVNLLMKTKKAELGYAIDSRFYGIGEYAAYIRSGLARLTVEDVNRAVRRHLRLKNVRVVMVARGCEELRKRIVDEVPSPVTYNSPKPEAILAEDKLVERYPLGITLANTRVVPLAALFE
jgi:zinc protease